jgi:hypothetical protein
MGLAEAVVVVGGGLDATWLRQGEVPDAAVP